MRKNFLENQQRRTQWVAMGDQPPAWISEIYEQIPLYAPESPEPMLTDNIKGFFCMNFLLEFDAKHF